MEGEVVRRMERKEGRGSEEEDGEEGGSGSDEEDGEEG